MGRATITIPAEQDLLDIGEHIAQDNPAAADRFVDELHATITMLAEQPKAGRVRTDLKGHPRCLPHGNYVIFYRPVHDGIEVLRVIHGARDVEKAF